MSTMRAHKFDYYLKVWCWTVSCSSSHNNETKTKSWSFALYVQRTQCRATEYRTHTAHSVSAVGGCVCIHAWHLYTDIYRSKFHIKENQLCRFSSLMEHAHSIRMRTSIEHDKIYIWLASRPLQSSILNWKLNCMNVGKIGFDECRICPARHSPKRFCAI